MTEIDSAITTARALNTTKRAATARIAVAARRSCPIPEASDFKGCGLVDFFNDRVWMRDQLIAERFNADMEASTEGLSRFIGRAIFSLVKRTVGREQDIYFEGGALWVRAARDNWRGPTGSLDGPKYTRHPLCVWAPMASAAVAYAVESKPEKIKGQLVRQYEVRLTAKNFGDVWSHIVSVEDRAEVAAMLWVDESLRIRRLSYESSIQDESVLWSITEFWDFGVTIPSQIGPSSVDNLCDE